MGGSPETIADLKAADYLLHGSKSIREDTKDTNYKLTDEDRWLLYGDRSQKPVLQQPVFRRLMTKVTRALGSF